MRVTKARKVKVQLDRKVRYELDGGDRSKVRNSGSRWRPGALRVRVPREERGGGPGCEPSAGPGRSARPVHRRCDRARARSSGSPEPALSPAAAIYGIIGVLAVEMAFGTGGKTTNQKGALAEIAQQPGGKILLALMAIGLFGYARPVAAARRSGVSQPFRTDWYAADRGSTRSTSRAGARDVGPATAWRSAQAICDRLARSGIARAIYVDRPTRRYATARVRIA